MASSTTFLKEFDLKYAPLLAHRREGFRTMFQKLEEQKIKNYKILETGCMRRVGNWDGDGQSTFLFDRFINTHQGNLFSVDISEEAVETASEVVSLRTFFRCGDSVKFLQELSPEHKFDLVYLDSYDVDFENPHPSSLHHLFELCAILHKNCKKGTIIAIDDNKEGKGKGQYVAQFLDTIGATKIYDGYQLIYQL